MIPRLSPPFDASDALAMIGGSLRPGGAAAFEAAAVSALGITHALAFSMGRSGLYALINVMGWRNRDIIVPAYTCAVVADAIVASGNRPRFVDVGLSDYNMKPEHIARTISGDTVAIIATHMYGFPMDMDALQDVLESRPDIVVIQDCALAFGSRSENRPVWQGSKVALFSFSIGKHLSTVEGGLIATSDKDLHDALKQYRDTIFRQPPLRRTINQGVFFLAAWLGLTRSVYRLPYTLSTRTRLLDFLTEYLSDQRVAPAANLGERLPSALGYLGANQIAKADHLVSRRIEISNSYRRRLGGLKKLQWPTPAAGASYSHCPCLVEDRDDLIRFMAGRGVHLGKEVFDYALPDLPFLKTYVEDKMPRDFPNARRIAGQVALLPNHMGLRDRDVERIGGLVEQWANL